MSHDHDQTDLPRRAPQPGPPRQPHHPASAEPAGGFDVLMAEVLGGSGGRFGHRQHVQLTWLAVRRYGMPAAIGLVSDGIRRTARYAGAPQKYHETISRAWVELVAHHAIGHPGRPAGDPDGTDGQPHPARAGGHRLSARSADVCVRTHTSGPGWGAGAEAGFAAFAAGNPLLLDKRLLIRFYRPATLASTAARTGWVEPDLTPFPWAAPG